MENRVNMRDFRVLRESRVIVFEGVDGSGKDSLMQRLYKVMADNNIPVKRTSSLNRQCKKAIENIIIRELQKYNPSKLELMYLRGLFIANLNRTARYVESLLQDGNHVLLTRWKHSILAYNTDTYKEMKAVDLLIHNLDNPIIFYIDTPIDICIDRLALKIRNNEKLDHFECKDKLIQAKLRYEEAMKFYPYGNIYRLDGSSSKQELLDKTCSILKLYNIL